MDFDLSTWLGAIPPVAEWPALFISFCEHAYYSTAFRLIFFLTIVFATIWMIAKVYSGNLQNAERGPVALRRHSAMSMPRNTIVVPRNLIDMSMDGVQARCTFMYVYDGFRGKRQHIKLLERQVTLSVSPAPLRSLQDVARANEVPDVASNEVYWPALDPETETPTVGEPTPDSARDYALQNNVLERWTGDDNLQLISLHQDVMNDVREAREDFIQGRVAKLRKAKNGNIFQRMSAGKWARCRPGAVGNYYLKFQFSNDPLLCLHATRIAMCA
jgi:hypothetical protein